MKLSAHRYCGGPCLDDIMRNLRMLTGPSGDRSLEVADAE